MDTRVCRRVAWSELTTEVPLGELCRIPVHGLYIAEYLRVPDEELFYYIYLYLFALFAYFRHHKV